VCYVLTALQIYRKSAKVRVSYCDFSKVCEMEKILRRKHETNFEGAYLRDGYADLTEIWKGMFPTLRDFPQQKMMQFRLGIIKLQIRENGVFLVPV